MEPPFIIAVLSTGAVLSAFLAAFLTPYSGLPADRVKEGLQKRRDDLQRERKEPHRAENTPTD